VNGRPSGPTDRDCANTNGLRRVWWIALRSLCVNGPFALFARFVVPSQRDEIDAIAVTDCSLLGGRGSTGNF